jgi:hypothetical protein
MKAIAMCIDFKFSENFLLLSVADVLSWGEESTFHHITKL